MKHSNTIQKEIHDLLKFRNDFVTLLDDQITEIFEFGKFNHMDKIHDTPSDDMTDEELQEFLQFQSYMLSKFIMLVTTYMDKIKSNDITVHAKKLQKDTT